MAIANYDIGDDSYYLYTCAQLNARESEFIVKPKLERMTAADTISDFLKILSETHYAGYINLINPEKNFDEVILAFNNESIIYLTDRLKPEHKSAIDLIMYEENIHNYKVILKALILKNNLKHLFLPSLYSYETLMNGVGGQDHLEIDAPVKTFLDKIISLKDQGLNLKKIELELERFYIDNLFYLMIKTGNRVLTDFIRHVIDIINIKNISRVKYTKVNLDFNEFLIDNGFLSLELLKKFEAESTDSIVRELDNSDYSVIIRNGTRSLYAYNTFFSFEKNEYIFYLNYFDAVKYSVANLEKITSFFIRKKIELKILNIIYLGILYGIEKGKISHKVEIISEN